MSAYVCPVCGCGYVDGSPACGFGDKCINAARLAIDRAAEIERLKSALERIAKQGPHYGHDGTYATWEHWKDIASEALTEANQLFRDDRRNQSNQEN